MIRVGSWATVDTAEFPREHRAHDARGEPAGCPATLVGDELQLVEQRLGELLRSREQRLSDIALYLIGSGGKRVRPAVTLLVFRACGGSKLRDIVDVAVALEAVLQAPVGAARRSSHSPVTERPR